MWEEVILAVVSAFMLATLAVLVFCRYFLSFSFSWAEQGARIGFVWITLIGFSLAAKKGMHLKIDILPQFFPKSAKAVNLFSEIVTILFGFGMGYLILKTVLMQIEFEQYFASIPWLPTWTMYIAGVIGFFGLSLRTMQNVYCSFKDNKQKPSVTETRSEEYLQKEEADS